MTVGDRIRDLLAQQKRSQAWLARRVGVDQSTINGLVNGGQRSSTHLHKIARELHTTPAYLTGETDDPDEGAPLPPPVPAIQYVTMQIALPPEPALAQMFEGLLSGLDGMTRAEQARHLARRLPTGLSQLRDLLPVQATPAAPKPSPSPPTPVPASR
ncbi:helix-turn-helix domain-containing protein [Sphingomonas sp.]|jgi:hypothetical protein|uniref:helix-turn-helix domain-containing protein n=1 Tax=Sphingomonas sp. TaxID=28214 RepID=UPI00262A0727|nr:helix-turn-helix transcriptional regulator [Sphingomonas sp.]